MEDNYINFSIDGRDLKIHKDNPDDVKMWKTHGNRGKMKNPRWKQIKIKTNSNGYKSITITPKQYQLHRINYYAHNQSWNIHDSCFETNSIDHENQDKTNNNIENLRVVTHQENCFNRTGKGYKWNKRVQKWEAYITAYGKYKYLGYFDLEEDAKNARLEAKKIYHTIQIRK